MIIEPSAPRTMHLEPGIYVVTCNGVRSGTLANPQFGSGEMVYLQLTVDNVIDPETRELAIIERMCSKVWSPRSALWGCAQALGYRCIAGEPIDTDHLIGKRCQAVVRDEVATDGNVYSRVDTLVPLPQQQGSPSAPSSPGPPPSQPLAQQLYEKANELAQQGHEREAQAYPPLNVLSQNGTSIDWDVFWQECSLRGITRQHLTERLGIYDRELDGHLRGMMAASVIDLLLTGPVRS